MKQKAVALRAAFPHTIPVLTGFMFLGIAYGVLMASKGYGFGWAVLMSLVVFAGSAQYVAITFLTSAFNPLYALFVTLMVNARHIFYGISMLQKFRETGKLKPYLVFGLCDETFSILSTVKLPVGVDKNQFMFYITLLNHSYWVLGTAAGGMIGRLLPIRAEGLDFALTALFVVIFMDQWKGKSEHFSAILGVVCSVVCLLIFGESAFIIPAMILILVGLTVRYHRNIRRENHNDFDA